MNINEILDNMVEAEQIDGWTSVGNPIVSGSAAEGFDLVAFQIAGGVITVEGVETTLEGFSAAILAAFGRDDS